MRHTRKVVKIARKYVRRGWRVVPIPRKEKAPRLKGWQKLRLDESDIAEYFDEDNNIGVLLGEPSNGLVDVDLDCGQAIFLAPSFLPVTHRVHGRKSKLDSHYWYRATPIPAPQKFCDVDGTCLVELRSTGQQTVAPPSLHPTGERLHWRIRGRTGRVKDAALQSAVKRLAAATLIARHWPKKGHRNDTTLALAGMLLRAGWDEIEVGDFVSLVAQAANDEEWAARKAVARTTRKRLDEDGKATGRPRLEAFLGQEVVTRLCEWLGIGPVSHVAVVTTIVNGSNWPQPLAKRALFGLAGEIVRAISPHTEADEAALLIQMLVVFGNVIGREPHVRVGAQRHHTNLFAIIAGRTSRARKGTALAEVKHFFETLDDVWLQTRIKSGLSSGEGLIWAVRDPAERKEQVVKGDQKVGQIGKRDPGVSDKRLLVVETEFASPLRVMRREGNTLSAVIRSAWDQGNLDNLTKNSPARATGAHISILGHITRDELLRELSVNESINGFANRFLWACAKRSRSLPFGGHIKIGKRVELLSRLRKAVQFAKDTDKLHFSEKAKKLWEHKYRRLTREIPGLLGGVTSRSEAQVLRLSLVYALLDSSHIIKTQHLRAAIAVWRYCENSARYIFGNAVGDPVADQILAHLRKNPKGLTRTEIREVFSRNRNESEINNALRVLDEYGLARCVREETGGRPSERWFAVR